MSTAKTSHLAFKAPSRVTVGTGAGPGAPGVCVQVTVRWGDMILATRRLSGDDEAAIGDLPGALTAIPCGALGEEGFVLAQVRGGRGSAEVPAGLVGRWERGAEVRLIAGPATVPLAAGASVTLWIDGFHLLVSAAREEKALWAPAPWTAGALGPLPHIAFAALAHAAAIGLAAQAAYASELTDDRAPSVTELRGYLAAAELRSEARDRILPGELGEGTGRVLTDQGGNGKPGGGRRAEGDEGAMGSRLSRGELPRRYAAPERDRDRPALADRSGSGAAALSTFVGLIAAGAEHAPHASFGDVAASSSDPIAAEGAMWARAIGERSGSGGLGLSGVGLGGGGDGEGVGLLAIGTVGHGRGPLGDGTGGNGAPLHGISGGSWGSWHHRSHGYRTGIGYRGYGHAKVSGRLPPEAIQRIIRQNFGRFRACYERGLAEDPALAGRVSTRFVIGRDGSVSSAADAGSNLPDARVVSCVVRAFYGLSFPAPPDAGLISVVYPIAFSPTG